MLKLSILEEGNQRALTAGAMVASPVDGLVRSGGNVDVLDEDRFAVGTDGRLIRCGSQGAARK